MKFFFSAFLCSLLTPAFGDHNDNWGWAQLDVTLPKALSDHTASISSENGMVYIAGGCDHELGNQFTPTDDDDGGFIACFSLSKSFYMFDPEDEEFETLIDLPIPRYRHSSAIVQNKVWLVGGRDIDDNLIPEVDVYDIEKREWTTYTLPESAQVSDHAGFAEPPSYVFIAGGYDQNYTALDTVYRIAVDETISENNLKLEDVAPLSTARGDIIGVSSTDGTRAFIGGGFTHANEFCEPLGSVEEYSFGDDKWNLLPDLANARGEIVFVELDNHLYALGGERQIEGICDYTGETDPGENTVGTDLVEVYENAWKVVENFRDHKFRFAAVGVEDKELIYTFGGQTAWDEGCKCFKTTNDIVVFGEGLSSGNSLSISVFTGLLVSTLGMGLLM